MIKQTYSTIEGGIFEQVISTKSLVMTSTALNPITTGAREKYRIHRGTVLGPIDSGGFVAPVVRSRIIATAPSGSASFYVDDASGFIAGDVCLYYNSLAGTAAAATVSTVTEATNLVTMTATHTAAAGDYLEKAYNGAHGNTTAAMSEGVTQTPDCVILLVDVDMLADDDTTVIAVPCVGVDAGVIRVSNLTGSCCATFDNVNLRAQLPRIRFDNVTAGS
jgi:hypothetical protein